jgi:Predicted permease, DMT superfamily
LSRGSKPSPLKLYSLIALMVFFWSLNFVVGKIALRDFPPMLLACLRTTLAGVFVLPVYLLHQEKTQWKARDVPLLIQLGVFGVALNQVFFVLGLNRTSVAHAALIIALTPLLVLLLASARGLEAFSARKVAGMAIAVGGVGVIHIAKSSQASFVGDLFVLLAAITFTIFTVFAKEATARHGSVTMNTFAYAGGAILLLPVTILVSRDFDFAGVSAAGWLCLIYMALFPSVLCYLIYYYVLTYIPASRVSAFSYLQPFVATLLAIPLLNEHVTISLIVGGTLVLLGVFVTERT